MNKSLARLAACLVAAGVLCAGGCRKQVAAPPARPLVPASELAETDVLPHTQGPITRGRNYVYCATFQIAWDEFRDKLLEGDPLQLSGSPPLADALNASRFARKNLADKDFLAIAGAVDDGVMDKIASEMQRRFPQSTLPLPENPGAGGAVAFAFLVKWLPFEKAFDRLPIKFKTRGNLVSVEAFGIDSVSHDSKSFALSSQVDVLDYQSDDDFVIRLVALKDHDHLVLAKVPSDETLGATIGAVIRRIERTDSRAPNESEDERHRRFRARMPLETEETLAVPIIHLDVDRAYDELEQRKLDNAAMNGVPLVIARQAIKFTLDEHGAKLESNSRMETKGDKSGDAPRKFIFDRPFLLLMAQSDAFDRMKAPYFAMWIETPELLEKQ